jgi:hypothetical protein
MAPTPTTGRSSRLGVTRAFSGNVGGTVIVAAVLPWPLRLPRKTGHELAAGLVTGTLRLLWAVTICSDEPLHPAGPVQSEWVGSRARLWLSGERSARNARSASAPGSPSPQGNNQQYKPEAGELNAEQDTAEKSDEM